MPSKLRAFAACCCALIVCGVSLSAQQIAVNKDNRTIAVTTSSDATADADTVTVEIGFIIYGTDQQSAYASGSKTSNAIARALKDAEIPADAIQSESQSITPVPQYGNQEWTPEEKAARKFQVQQSWSVKTAATNGARVLDIAVKAGANQSGQMIWSVADQDGLQAKAAKLALERARQIAQQMATGLNATLGPLVYASNEAPSRPVEPLMRMAPMAAKAAPPEVEPLSVSARKVTASAMVYAVFSIQ